MNAPFTRKGITPVVAIVILLMMTVAIAGGFYAFSEGFFSDQLSEVDRMQSTDISIKTVECQASGNNVRFAMTNSGDVELRANPVDVFVYAAGNDSLIGTGTISKTDFTAGSVWGPEQVTDSGSWNVQPGFANGEQYRVEFDFRNEPNFARSDTCLAQ